MKTYIYKILITVIATAIWACSDFEEINKSIVGTEEVWTTIDFGHKDFENISITTRSLLGEVAESRVLDMYVLIFAGDNMQCVYNRYFGSSSDVLMSTPQEVTAAAREKKECWYVYNRVNESNTAGYTDQDTHGRICIKTPKVENARMYLIANANAYTVNISPDKLNMVRTEKELQQLTATLKGDVVTRYGYFPMVAMVDKVSINDQKVSSSATGLNSLPARLVRLDSKVEVNVRAATGHTYLFEGTEQKVKTFQPESWRIVNIPKGAYIVENGSNDDAIAGYFNTAQNRFEKSENIIYDDHGTQRSTVQNSFSFYMLENRQTPAANERIVDGDYHKRDLRTKNADGTYATGEDKWQHAPENATYMEIRGYLSMDVTDTDMGTHELGADVVYYIHLGDFASDVNNFSIDRNTHYKYTITIKGVQHIEIEVSTSNDDNEGIIEGQSGAAGDVFVTQSEAKLFDAHYDQFVYELDARTLDSNLMSWYVKTPFGQKGSPKFTEGTLLSDFDYKWVWFMVNPIEGGAYSTVNQWYPGDQNRTGGSSGLQLGDSKHLMNVDEFVNYMKSEKIKYDNNQGSIFLNNKVYVSAFIDEFYYEKDPMGSNTSDDFWKSFVNQPNRLMHVLCGSQSSLDKESSMTNSVITIRQRSIQTPYNIKLPITQLETGWGCETIDEQSDNLLWFYRNAGGNDLPRTIMSANNSDDNGRYNTALLLELIGSSDLKYKSNIRWDTFLDYRKKNDELFLNNNYKSLLYASLLRNRDSNGNGVIDAEELKWYIASIGQLYGIYLGELGFQERKVALYTQEMANNGTAMTTGGNYQYYPWRKHIVSSTYDDDRDNTSMTPIEIWGEEGISTGFYKQYRSGSESQLSIRCVRDLGMDESNANAVTNIENKDNYPQALVKYTIKDASGNIVNESAVTSSNFYYEFDLSRINEYSLRSTPTEMELVVKNEFEDLSRPYKYFKTGAWFTYNNTYPNLRTNYLNSQTNPLAEGWRLPNVREGAILRLYCNKQAWWNNQYTLVSTCYYNGRKDNGGIGNNTSAYSWVFGYNFASVANMSANICPVKDYNP